MIDLMQSMNPVLHVALLFTLFCYALAVCMALWRLLHGPSAQDRILALDYVYMVAMLAVNLAFGVLGRAAPALNPIQLGLPTALLLGLFLLALLAGELGPPVQRVFDLSFDAARQLTR